MDVLNDETPRNLNQPLTPNAIFVEHIEQDLLDIICRPACWAMYALMSQDVMLDGTRNDELVSIFDCLVEMGNPGAAERTRHAWQWKTLDELRLSIALCTRIDLYYFTGDVPVRAVFYRTPAGVDIWKKWVFT